jgi:lipopolysaccharide transport system permease protein
MHELVKINPVTGLVESFRHGFFGKGGFNLTMIVYDAVFILLTVCIGLLLFNRVERDFVDTV